MRIKIIKSDQDRLNGQILFLQMTSPTVWECKESGIVVVDLRKELDDIFWDVLAPDSTIYKDLHIWADYEELGIIPIHEIQYFRPVIY